MVSARCTISSIVLALVSGVSAFQIHGVMTHIQRADPIVSPGGIADHTHMIMAGSNFGASVTEADMASSQCSAVETQQDKSAYWMPAMFGRNPNGTLSALPISGVSVYYQKVSSVSQQNPEDGRPCAYDHDGQLDRNWVDNSISRKLSHADRESGRDLKK
jgi:hypothetical protein